MAAVNYERVLLRLKEHVLSKPSHGTRDLLAEIARLEVECEVPESEEGYSSLPARVKPADELPAREPVMATH